MLSAEELVMQNIALQKAGVPSLSRGLKDVFQTGDVGEEAGIRALQDDLFQMLNQQRIERVSVRSQADYLPNQLPSRKNVIQVTRKMGKWNQFGHIRGGLLYLHPHEALHLIEMNRLELYFNSVLVSLEQAYVLLLCAENLTSDAFFVYSQLMRAGYVVDLHDANNSYNRLDGFGEHQQISKKQQSVWTCLQQLLSNSENPLQSTDPYLRTTAESMRSIADRIRNPQSYPHLNLSESTDDSATSWNTTKSLELSRKRKHEISIPVEHKNEPFLDKLLEDSNIRDFSLVFNNIQVIHLTNLEVNCNDYGQTESFEIVFDLFAANADHRKSDPGPPTHRIVVCHKNRDVPTRKDIYQIYSKLTFRTPILVVFVNELMSMQAYVYVMSS